jgi:hypothetical protein
VQENILERYPDAELRVYAVWVPVLATDERFEVADLMVDGRVRHYWDGERLVGDAIGPLAGGSEGDVVWDVFFAFGPQARWAETPPEPLSFGAPVVEATDRLEAALMQHLELP